MSLFDQINKTARQVAKLGLSKIGINIHDSDLPRDPDTDDRDLFDFFLHSFDSRKKPQPLPPIPEDLQNAAFAWAETYCGDNDELRRTIQEFLKIPENFALRNTNDLSSIQKELIELLKLHQVLLDPPGTPKDTLPALQKIAVAQKRKCCNLLRKASAQIDTDDPQTWLNEMNSRLQRFDLEIAADPYLTIRTLA